MDNSPRPPPNEQNIPRYLKTAIRGIFIFLLSFVFFMFNSPNFHMRSLYQRAPRADSTYLQANLGNSTADALKVLLTNQG